MPRTLCKSNKPLYLNVFPSWKGRQPLRFFMMENLLEARMGSGFPTNGAGPDEDVNVFLAALLTDFLGGDHHPDLVSGAGCLFEPPDKDLGRRRQAAWYVANANHRLLYLGLLDRGDGMRRQRVPFGLDPDEARARDLGIGRDCYLMAANLLEGRNLVPAAVVAVYRKLGENFADYVHVLAAMATRHLGLGACLSEGDLAGLLRPDGRPASEMEASQPLPPDHPALDHLLDLVLEYQQSPDEITADRIRTLAARTGTDYEQLISGLRRT